MARLRQAIGPAPGRVYELKRGVTMLGRNPNSDVHIDHDAVSRPHAKVEYANNGYYLEDLNSLNGTRVNGRPIAKGPQGRIRLRSGDRIKICGFVFVFEAEDSSSSATVRLVEDRVRPRITTVVDMGSSSVNLQLDVNAAAKLKALISITTQLAKALHVQDVAPRILDTLFQIFTQADRGLVILRQGESDELAVAAVKFAQEQDEATDVSKTIIDEVLRTRTAVLSNDAVLDSRFSESESVHKLRLRSLMCVPLLGGDGETFGAIELDVLTRRNGFRDEDLDLLACVARQMAVFFENARLHEVALREQRAQDELKRIAQALELARRVQRGLMPTQPPVVAGYEFFAIYQPAEQVGGDYYDYIFLPGDRLAVVVADVSGEGVPAAIMMANFAGQARQLLAAEASPAAAIARLNASLTAAGHDGRFITMVCAILDPRAHEVTIVNAGHWEPLLRRADGTISRISLPISESDYPLGWFADAAYHEHKLQLLPGDKLLLFTDGIHEAQNAQHKMYGLDTLLRVYQQLPCGPVPVLCQALFNDVCDFIGECSQSDDMCLMCFGRLEA